MRRRSHRLRAGVERTWQAHCEPRFRRTEDRAIFQPRKSFLTGASARAPECSSDSSSARSRSQFRSTATPGGAIWGTSTEAKTALARLPHLPQNEQNAPQLPAMRNLHKIRGARQRPPTTHPEYSFYAQRSGSRRISADHAGISPLEHHQQIDGGNGRRDYHDGQAHLRELHKRYGIALAVGDAGKHHVGRRTHQRAVAAQACAQRNGPP